MTQLLNLIAAAQTNIFSIFGALLGQFTRVGSILRSCVVYRRSTLLSDLFASETSPYPFTLLLSYFIQHTCIKPNKRIPKQPNRERGVVVAHQLGAFNFQGWKTPKRGQASVSSVQSLCSDAMVRSHALLRYV